jgi:hypothetical protein
MFLKDFQVLSWCSFPPKGIFSFHIWLADPGAEAVAESLGHILLCRGGGTFHFIGKSLLLITPLKLS